MAAYALTFGDDRLKRPLMWSQQPRLTRFPAKKKTGPPQVGSLQLCA